MKEKILSTVEQAFLKAEAFYKVSIPRPTEIIFKRNGTRGGRCTMNFLKDKRTLEYQLDLAENHPEDYENTVLHEVAHYVQFFIYWKSFNQKIKPHGWEWQYVMTRVYGLNPDRCHNYDVTVTKVKRELRHQYSCLCGLKHNISSTMHNRLQSALKLPFIPYKSLTTGREYIAPSYRKVCSTCKSDIFLVKVGDMNQKKIEDMKRELERLQRRLVA